MESREPIELPVERIPNTAAGDADAIRTWQVRFGTGDPELPPHRPRRIRQPRRFLPALLFLLTCASTFYVGGVMHGRGRVINDEWAWNVSTFISGGLKYGGALMVILVAHEMGHWIQARRYGVPASWPWFIPVPSPPLGTMGAVIVQASGYANRKQLFDIGISGPLAGLVLAIPITILGLQDSEIINVAENAGGMSFGNPLILTWLAELQFGPLAPGEDVALTPFLHAGWVGIFVTSLNLIPIGQLDGGHVLYCLIGRKAHAVARALLWLAVGSMIVTGDWSYSVMVFLLLMMGTRHPPSSDDSVPLGRCREVLGWLTLSFILIGFTPTPITLQDRDPPQRREHQLPQYVENTDASEAPPQTVAGYFLHLCPGFAIRAN